MLDHLTRSQSSAEELLPQSVEEVLSPVPQVVAEQAHTRNLSERLGRGSLTEEEVNWLRREVPVGSQHKIPREYIPSARVARIFDESDTPPETTDQAMNDISGVQTNLGHAIKGLVQEWAVRQLDGKDRRVLIDGIRFDPEFEDELFSRIRLRVGQGSRFFNLLLLDMKDAMRTGATIEGAWGRVEWRGRKLHIVPNADYPARIVSALDDVFNPASTL